MDDDICPICYDNVANEVLECTHAFCAPCVREWKAQSRHEDCPLCRAKLDFSKSWVVNEAPTQEEIEAAFRDFIQSI